MKISGVEIRPGNIIEYEGGIWKVTKIQHTQPGKGGAYMQVEAKNLIDGRKLNNRFRSADTVEKVRLDTKDFQYLYAEGDDLVFMDVETYDQINLPSDLLGDAAAFLQDGMTVLLEMGKNFDLDKASDMQRIRSWVKPNVSFCHLFIQLFLRSRRHIRKKSAPF